MSIILLKNHDNLVVSRRFNPTIGSDRNPTRLHKDPVEIRRDLSAVLIGL